MKRTYSPLKKCKFCGQKIIYTNIGRHEPACYKNPKNVKHCIQCGKIIKITENRFCNHICAAKYNNIHRKKCKCGPDKGYKFKKVKKYCRICKKSVIVDKNVHAGNILCKKCLKIVQKQRQKHLQKWKQKQRQLGTKIDNQGKLSKSQKTWLKKYPPVTKICPGCGKKVTFKYSYRDYKYCCLECYKKDAPQWYPHKGYYKGYWCDSSWELAWIIYHLEHNIKFIRNKKGFPYRFRKKSYTYYPDFYMPQKNLYIEVKGRKEKSFDNKMKSFKGRIKVFDYNKMKPILKYVKSKYGEDFVKLYDKSYYNRIHKAA